MSGERPLGPLLRFSGLAAAGKFMACSGERRDGVAPRRGAAGLPATAVPFAGRRLGASGARAAATSRLRRQWCAAVGLEPRGRARIERPGAVQETLQRTD